MAKHDFSTHRLFVTQPLAKGNRFILDREQANYLVNVLRLGEGDGFLVFNGKEGEWQARLSGGSRKSPEVEVFIQVRSQPVPSDLWYLFAPLKSARLDYMVQKAVEMGATRLVPVLTRRTQVTRINLERMRANVIEAAEQCGILVVAEVTDEVTLPKLLEDWPRDRTLVFCDEDAPVKDPVTALQAVAQGSPLAVLIGPEGGFDEAERSMLAKVPGHLRLSLGPRILRADTAAVAALALVQGVLGDYLG